MFGQNYRGFSEKFDFYLVITWQAYRTHVANHVINFWVYLFLNCFLIMGNFRILILLADPNEF